jgi:hypothetical protein
MDQTLKRMNETNEKLIAFLKLSALAGPTALHIRPTKK